MNKEYKDAIKLGDIYMENFGEDNSIYILQGQGYAYLKDEKNYSDYTITNYSIDIEEFYVFLKKGF